MTFTQRLTELRRLHPEASRKVLVMAVRFQMGLESLDDMTFHHIFPQPCYKYHDAKPLLTFDESKAIINACKCD